MAWDEKTSAAGDGVTRAIADQLDLPVEEFIEVFGAGWQPMPKSVHDSDSDPSGAEDVVGQWFVAGDPFQLMLRIRPDLEAIELARPKGDWVGHRLMWRPEPDSEIVPRGDSWRDAASAIPALLGRRRRSFRYCRYCRELTTPEFRMDADSCQSCANTWHGVIY